MRDPNRIDDVLALLGEVWKADPDLRLGQLVNAAGFLAAGAGRPTWQIEDDDMRRGLVIMLNEVNLSDSDLAAAQMRDPAAVAEVEARLRDEDETRHVIEFGTMEVLPDPDRSNVLPVPGEYLTRGDGSRD